MGMSPVATSMIVMSLNVFNGSIFSVKNAANRLKENADSMYDQYSKIRHRDIYTLERGNQHIRSGANCILLDKVCYAHRYKGKEEEKKIWDKDSGRMYAHNVISFHKDEDITDEQAFEFGNEFAQGWFDGFQTLVAVHQDKDHVHIHLVTNSVSYEDGRKLHQTKKDLQKAKDYVNDMCRQRGLTIAEKGKHFDGSDIEQGEVTSWDKNTYNMLKDDSKKSFLIDCLAAFLNAISQAFDVQFHEADRVLFHNKNLQLKLLIL
mgnify:CR=1 FL=1